MENVWDYLRGNKSSSLAGDSYEAMRDASKEAWNFIANDPDGILSIGTRDWACVSHWGGWYKIGAASEVLASSDGHRRGRRYQCSAPHDQRGKILLT